MERHRRGGAGLPLLELHQAVEALPASVRRKQWLEREDLNPYKTLGRPINDMEGVVVAGRLAGEGQGYCMRYGISATGAELSGAGAWGDLSAGGG